jgi:protein phosphatase
MNLDGYGGSIHGPRDVQQDRWAIRITPGGGMLAVIADGMGGHAAGATASRLCIEAAIATWMAADTPQAPRTVNRQVIANASTLFREHQRKNPLDYGMGSTLTSLAILDGTAYTAHAGDSRLTRIRRGHDRMTVEQITEDHNLAARMMKSSNVPWYEVSHLSHHITCAVGHLNPDLVEHHRTKVKPGDVYLLTTDGVHDYVDMVDLCRWIWNTGEGVKRIVERTLDLARQTTKDNAACVAVVVREA